MSVSYNDNGTSISTGIDPTLGKGSRGTKRDPNELTPSGEWLCSDVVGLREGLNNIKGKLYNILYAPNNGADNILAKAGECKRVLWEIYEMCDTSLWGGTSLGDDDTMRKGDTYTHSNRDKENISE